MPHLAPVSSTQRLEALDVLRGFSRSPDLASTLQIRASRVAVAYVDVRARAADTSSTNVRTARSLIAAARVSPPLQGEELAFKSRVGNEHECGKRRGFIALVAVSPDSGS